MSKDIQQDPNQAKFGFIDNNFYQRLASHGLSGAIIAAVLSFVLGGGLSGVMEQFSKFPAAITDSLKSVPAGIDGLKSDLQKLSSTIENNQKLLNKMGNQITTLLNKSTGDEAIIEDDSQEDKPKSIRRKRKTKPLAD